MTYLPYIVFGASMIIPLVQFTLLRRSRRMEGKDSPVTNPEIDEKLSRHGQVLLYFFTPLCDACQVMAPRIDRMVIKYDNIIKLNAKENKDLALSFGLVATPTVILIKKGKIAKIVAGITSEKKLSALLE